MAGHSKWANIQHRKNAQDAKRGKLFTKLIREITVAARLGGDDAASNPRLRAALDKALSNNMNKDTLERAIKRGAGALDGAHYEEVRYEGYAVGGVAVLVECMTDNRNRTVAEVRHAFSKCGGNLGTDGSVSFLFNNMGIISYAPGANEDKILEIALDVGADDVITNKDQSIDVTIAPEHFINVKEAMMAANLEPQFAEITLQATTSTAVDIEDAKKVLKLVDMLEDLDDVQNVYTNAEFSDSVLSQLK